MRRIRVRRPLDRIISVDSYNGEPHKEGRRRVECIRGKEVVNTIKEDELSAIFNVQATSLQQYSQHSNTILSPYNPHTTEILKDEGYSFHSS